MNAACDVRVWRGAAIESRHAVRIAVADGAGKLVLSCGDPDEPVFLRSAAKPFQAVPALSSGALDRVAPADEELAVVCGSHGGEEGHVAVVRRLLGRLRLGEDRLRCGVHPPLDPAAARSVGDGAGAVHHNCSGKHAGMLALAVHLGVDPGEYLDPDGPVQRRVLEAVAEMCGVAPDAVVLAIDGCSAPNFAVPLRAAARAFALLARPAAAPLGLRRAITRIARAMSAHPWHVAGTGRFDTVLMGAAGGRLVAKAGAEGVQGIADRETGYGLALKVVDGSSRAVAPAALEALSRAGMASDDVLRPLEAERQPILRNHAGITVGRIETRLAV